MQKSQLINPGNKNTNWDLLGATRYFLASIVAIAHLKWYFEGSQSILWFSEFSATVAVLGFLLISGYSIAASYDNQAENFYYRRVLRIMPLYILCVAGSVVTPLVMGGVAIVPGRVFETPNIMVLMSNLVFLQDISTRPISTNPIVWTLTIEVFFYICTPILAKRKFYVISMLVISALSFAIFPQLKLYYHLYYYSDLLYGLSILFLGWAWLLGFWYYHNKNTLYSTIFVMVVGIFLIKLNGLYLESLGLVTWFITAAVIGFGYMIPKLKISSFLKLAGDASYPLYLLHIPVFLLFFELGMPHIGIVYFLMVSLISILVYKYIDNPVKAILRGRIKIKNSR